MAAARGAAQSPTLPPDHVLRHARPDVDLVDDATGAARTSASICIVEWASTRLLIPHPIWILAGGPARTQERLADQPSHKHSRRPAARGQLFAGSAASRHPDRLPAAAREPPVEGRTLGELIDAPHDPVDALCDLLLAEIPAEESARPNLEARDDSSSSGGDDRHDSVFAARSPAPGLLQLPAISASSCATRRFSVSRTRSPG